MLKECMICHYWFFNRGFEFQNSVCNGCHYLTMLSADISDLANITIKNVDYHRIFITLANMKQLIFRKLYAKNIKNIVLYIKNILNF